MTWFFVKHFFFSNYRIVIRIFIRICVRFKYLSGFFFFFSNFFFLFFDFWVSPRYYLCGQLTSVCPNVCQDFTFYPRGNNDTHISRHDIVVISKHGSSFRLPEYKTDFQIFFFCRFAKITHFTKTYAVWVISPARNYNL